MQPYADIYSLQNYSTCFGCRSTHHSPDQTTVEGSNGTSIMTCTRGCVYTVFNNPDDGCCDTRNMYSSFAVNKYLHSVSSVGFLFILSKALSQHNATIKSQGN